MNFNYFDSHSHLNFADYGDDLNDVLQRMSDEGVGTITIGVDFKSSKDAVILAEKNNIYCAIGVHPTDNLEENFDEQSFLELSKSDKVVAVGECGIDYFRTKLDDNFEKERQKKLFVQQIEFAIKIGKPLMIHGRPSKGTMDAYEDILEILNSYFLIQDSNLRGNVHFFAGDVGIAQKFIDIGFNMSFTGVITFARDYDEVIKYLPLESVLSETDCPFVAPAPYRGKRNEPVYVKEVVKKIADIRGEDFDKVRLAMIENTKRVFGI